MKTFEDFKSIALDESHPAWGCDPLEKKSDDVTLIVASKLTSMILNNEEVDPKIVFRQHSTRPFCVWVKRG